jgi:hypothetical protein
MKNKSESAAGVQELCRRLKLQLDELSITMDTIEHQKTPSEDDLRREKLMEQLKRQLAELSR